MPAPLKSEDRNPKIEGGPISEIREWIWPMRCYTSEKALDAGFAIARPRPARRSSRRGR